MTKEEHIKFWRESAYHNHLVRLAELSKIELSDEQKFSIDKINDFNIQTRYPES